MSKPEKIRGIPIPADVDADTWRSAADAMASEGWFATSMIRGAYAAILAAKTEERESCAQVADHAMNQGANTSQSRSGNNFAAAGIAAAIRKRGEG